MTAQWLSPFDSPIARVAACSGIVAHAQHARSRAPWSREPAPDRGCTRAYVPVIHIAACHDGGACRAQIPLGRKRLDVSLDGAKARARERSCLIGFGIWEMQCQWRATRSGKVDVKGQALSVVVIDNCRFSPPDDPLLAARLAAIESAGGNAFMEYQVRAAIVLKQGAGRLIAMKPTPGADDRRPAIDREIYGRRIWQSLPPMRRTRQGQDAVEFFMQTFVNGTESGASPVVT